MKAVQHYLNFPGNTEEAFNFYKSVFGGDFLAVIRFKDMPMDGYEVSETDSDKIMHISLPIGNNIILMATDALESMGQNVTFGNNHYIYIAVDNKEEADKIFNKLSAGGTIEMAMGDVPWGSYFGSFKDKFGIMWMLDYEYPKA